MSFASSRSPRASRRSTSAIRRRASGWARGSPARRRSPSSRSSCGRSRDAAAGSRPPFRTHDERQAAEPREKIHLPSQRYEPVVEPQRRRAELAPTEHLPGQNPARDAERVEVPDRDDAESGTHEKPDDRSSAVAPEVTVGLVEAAEEGRVVRDLQQEAPPCIQEIPESVQHASIVLQVLEDVQADDRVDRPPSEVVAFVVQVEQPIGDVRDVVEPVAEIREVARMGIGQDHRVAASHEELRDDADPAPDLDDGAAEVWRDDVVDPFVVEVRRLLELVELLDEQAVLLGEFRAGGIAGTGHRPLLRVSRAVWRTRSSSYAG